MRGRTIFEFSLFWTILCHENSAIIAEMSSSGPPQPQPPSHKGSNKCAKSLSCVHICCTCMLPRSRAYVAVDPIQCHLSTLPLKSTAVLCKNAQRNLYMSPTRNQNVTNSSDLYLTHTCGTTQSILAFKPSRLSASQPPPCFWLSKSRAQSTHIQ